MTLDFVALLGFWEMARVFYWASAARTFAKLLPQIAEGPYDFGSRHCCSSSTTAVR